MIAEVICADKKYDNAVAFNMRTARKKGGVDKIYRYTTEDIDPDFRQKNQRILSQKRGNGYWLWKPYFIWKTLEMLKDGDYLIYCDAGAYFIHSVKGLIQAMERQQDDVMAFALPAQEYRYTKRDIFLALDADSEAYTHTPQRMASIILMKKTAHSQALVADWLKFAQQDELITDAPNALGKENYEGFTENRHDQSIFSVLSKKYGVRAYRDATQFGLPCGVGPFLWKNRKLYQGTVSDYPVTFIHHRRFAVTWKVRLEIRMQYIFPKGYAVYRKFIKPSIW